MTKEEAKEILISTLRDINSNDNSFEYTTEQFTEAMLIAIESLSNLPLPSNLDEATEKYANIHYGEFVEVEYEFGDPIETIVDDKPFMRDAFKAGATWMAGQGYVEECTVRRTPLNGPAGICMNLYERDGFKLGDKVIVQIRKK